MPHRALAMRHAFQLPAHLPTFSFLRCGGSMLEWTFYFGPDEVSFVSFSDVLSGRAREHRHGTAEHGFDQRQFTLDLFQPLQPFLPNRRRYHLPDDLRRANGCPASGNLELPLQW